LSTIYDNPRLNTIRDRYRSLFNLSIIYVVLIPSFLIFICVRNVTYPFGLKNLLKTEEIYGTLAAQHVRYAFDLIDEIILLLVSGERNNNTRSDECTQNT